MTLLLLVRHGLTPVTGRALSGRAPGVSLDDRGRKQAAALAERLAGVPLDAVVSSPLERCQETAGALTAARPGPPMAVMADERLTEVGYGDWTGQELKVLARDPLWPVVQAHPSGVVFPGPEGEAMAGMRDRALAAVRDWNTRLGADAVYVICTHADVIKAVVADALGLHLDLYQRIGVDPCSLAAIRYTKERPFVLRVNDTGGEVSGLTRERPAAALAAAGQDAGE